MMVNVYKMNGAYRMSSHNFTIERALRKQKLNISAQLKFDEGALTTASGAASLPLFHALPTVFAAHIKNCQRRILNEVTEITANGVSNVHTANHVIDV